MNLHVIDESFQPVLISGLHKHRRKLVALYLLAFSTIYTMMGYGSIQFIMPEIADHGIHFWYPRYDVAPEQYWATWIAIFSILALQGGFLLYPRSKGWLSIVLWQSLSFATSLNISIVCLLTAILLHDAVLAQPLGLTRSFFPIVVAVLGITLGNWFNVWRGDRRVEWQSPVLRLLRRLIFASALLFVVGVASLLGSRSDTEPRSANLLAEMAAPISLISGLWSLGPALILHLRLKPPYGRQP